MENLSFEELTVKLEQTSQLVIDSLYCHGLHCHAKKVMCNNCIDNLKGELIDLQEVLKYYELKKVE